MTRFSRREIDERIAIAERVLLAGGNMSAFAKKARMKPAAASKWMGQYAPELRDKLAFAGQGGGPGYVLARLLLIRVAFEFYGGNLRLAKALKVKPQTLSKYIERWAPDGLDQAIEDFWPDDSPPVFNLVGSQGRLWMGKTRV